MSEIPAPNGVITWRVDRAERDLQKLDNDKANKEDVLSLREEVKSLKRIVIFCFTGIFVAVVSSALFVVYMGGTPT